MMLLSATEEEYDIYIYIYVHIQMNLRFIIFLKKYFQVTFLRYN